MAFAITLCALAFANQAAAPTSSVPFRIADNAIIVDAAVNGRTVSLMFDTGFGAAVDVSDNVNIGKPTGSMNLIDFRGSFEAPTVKITSLKLGSKSIDTVGMTEAVLSREDTSSAYGMHCDGLMGFEVIKRNITGINMQHSRFDFYPSSMDISKWVPDNKKTFLAKLLPTGHSSMEMSVETPSGKRMVLALDTGNQFYATTHKDVLERVGLWDGGTTPKFMRQAFIASGAVDSWYLKLKDMKIFGIPAGTAVWDVIDVPSGTAEGDGTVGFGFLHNFNMIVDYDRRRVWFENYTGETSGETLGEPGIMAAGDRRTNEVRVFRVVPNSPAERAGIKMGDSLLAVGGEDLDGNVGYRRMKGLLEGPIGSKVNLTVSSGGELKRVDLERSALYNEIGKP